MGLESLLSFDVSIVILAPGIFDMSLNNSMVTMDYVLWLNQRVNMYRLSVY